jgi:hypothetical protein
VILKISDGGMVRQKAQPHKTILVAAPCDAQECKRRFTRSSNGVILIVGLDCPKNKLFDAACRERWQLR